MNLLSLLQKHDPGSGCFHTYTCKRCVGIWRECLSNHLGLKCSIFLWLFFLDALTLLQCIAMPFWIQCNGKCKWVNSLWHLNIRFLSLHIYLIYKSVHFYWNIYISENFPSLLRHKRVTCHPQGKEEAFSATFNIALLSLPPITVDGGILVTELGHTTK